MIDCFELLQEPRRPWIDADALKSRFLELSTAAHPDRVHGGTESERAQANARSAELNAAYKASAPVAPPTITPAPAAPVTPAPAAGDKPAAK